MRILSQYVVSLRTVVLPVALLTAVGCGDDPATEDDRCGQAARNAEMCFGQALPGFAEACAADPSQADPYLAMDCPDPYELPGGKGDSSQWTWQGSGTTLGVMTWNVGRPYIGWESLWDSRLQDDYIEDIAKSILRVNPHVVSFQEVRGHDQIEMLVDKLGWDWYGATAGGGYDRKIAVVTRLPAQFHDIPTSSTRYAQAAVLTLPNGTKATFVGVHLDSTNKTRRRQQIEEMLNGAYELPHESVILAGDFNFDVDDVDEGSSDDEIYDMVTEDFAMWDDGAEAGSTHILWWKRIDYIFDNVADVYDSRAKVYKGLRFGFMDHYPLVVGLDLYD